MNDLDHDLEMELRRFEPAAAPTRLSAAIGRALHLTAPSRSHRIRVSLWMSWTLTAAAAAIAAAAWWPEMPRAVQADSPGFAAEPRVVPVGTSNVLFDARDEGIVLLEDGRAAHKVRLHYVDTVRLQDREDRSSIAVSRPREEVRFVPVNFY